MKIYSNETTLQVIDACIRQRLPVLLRGETGVGKTSIVKYAAGGRQLTRINLTGQTTREDLVGKYILFEGNLIWQDGPLVTALREGHWLLLDEINAALPEVLFVIQALLENSDQGLGNILLVEKNGELLSPHADSRIFATCNPSDYDGVKDLNAATMSRFVVVDIHPLDVHQEEQLLRERYDVDIALSLAQGASKARELKKKGETMIFVSTRDLELAARLYAEKIDVNTALATAILAKCQSSVDYEVISKCFDIKKSKAKKSFMETHEELKAENKKLKEQVKSNDVLLSALRELSSRLPQKEEGVTTAIEKSLGSAFNKTSV